MAMQYNPFFRDRARMRGLMFMIGHLALKTDPRGDDHRMTMHRGMLMSMATNPNDRCSKDVFIARCRSLLGYKIIKSHPLEF